MVDVSEPARSHGLKLIPEFVGIAQSREIWRIADEAGFAHCWAYDHLLPVKGERSGPTFDGWSLMGAMAEATRHVRVGVLVTGNTYRHPGLLAKMAATIDHLSGGRLEFALGAGWAKYEHQMFDLEYGTTGNRLARLNEAVQIVKLLWTEDISNFNGQHYTITDAVAYPKPVQEPHPPIWIGGRGERKTLRIVARHADVWNVSGLDVDEDIRLSRVLDAYCFELGREPRSLRRTVQLHYAGDTEAVLRESEQYLAAGFDEIIFSITGRAGGREPVADAERAARDVLPRLQQIGPATASSPALPSGRGG
jgi:F420-dependent oxidoreductase-like protein